MKNNCVEDYNITSKYKICVYVKDKILNGQAHDIIKNASANFNEDYYKTMGFCISEYINKNNPSTLYLVYFINPNAKKEVRKLYLNGSHRVITDDDLLKDEMPEENMILLDKNKKSDSGLETELLKNFI
jgi:hypothetical protein